MKRAYPDILKLADEYQVHSGLKEKIFQYLGTYLCKCVDILRGHTSFETVYTVYIENGTGVFRT